MTAEQTSGAAVAAPADVLAFWHEAGPEKWFKKDAAFDAEIVKRFLTTYEAAVLGKLGDWEATPDGVLALLIVLDQFPRNMFRNSPRAFAADHMARDVAERAIARGLDAQVPVELRGFVYLPLMHSEALADQERCVELYKPMNNENATKFAVVHLDIIRRFGRFPHRNGVLGRTTTPEEQAFLDGGGFAG